MASILAQTDAPTAVDVAEKVNRFSPWLRSFFYFTGKIEPLQKNLHASQSFTSKQGKKDAQKE